MRAGGLVISVAVLERLSGLLRPSKGSAGVVLPPSELAGFGWDPPRLAEVMRALDFVPVGKAASDGALIWRRRRETPAKADAEPKPHSPFAVLAAMSAQTTQAPPPRRRRSRRRQPKVARA
jgi:hypothetical protein